MNLNALLDVDVVSVEAEDQVSLLLELVAPERDAGSQRPPGTLQVVLDRSGSMGDGRLEAAKDALEALIARLDPADNFGLVVFDDQVQVPVPAGPLTDKDRVRALIRGIWPGGMTNLSAGYLRGIRRRGGSPRPTATAAARRCCCSPTVTPTTASPTTTSSTPSPPRPRGTTSAPRRSGSASATTRS